jgi:hypothetical protein
MRRIALSPIVILAILLLVEMHPGDGERQPVFFSPIPLLWESAWHQVPASRSEARMVAAAHATRTLNCPMLVSVELGDPYDLTSVEDGVRSQRHQRHGRAASGAADGSPVAVKRLQLKAETAEMGVRSRFSERGQNRRHKPLCKNDLGPRKSLVPKIEI